MTEPRPTTLVWSCPEDGCTYRINRGGQVADAADWDARVVPRMAARHAAVRHGVLPENVGPER